VLCRYDGLFPCPSSISLTVPSPTTPIAYGKTTVINGKVSDTFYIVLARKAVLSVRLLMFSLGLVWMLSDSFQSMYIGMVWGGILFKFYSNPPQHMYINVNPTTSKQDLSVLNSSVVAMAPGPLMTHHH
jgi:hypothetical protein